MTGQAKARGLFVRVGKAGIEVKHGFDLELLVAVVRSRRHAILQHAKGARASAVVYSVTETAIENGLIAFEYLRHPFEKIRNLYDGNADEVLPWSPSLPNTCRAGKNG